MKLLFVCGKNRRRSPTAEIIFSEYDSIETRSAGVNRDSDTVLSEEMINWADIVFVMEDKHRTKIQRKYRELFKSKKIINLNIKDNYGFMDSELTEILEKKVRHYLKKTVT